MKCIVNGQIFDMDSIDKKWHGTDYFSPKPQNPKTPKPQNPILV